MPDKYQNKYRIPSARLQTWDYGSNASYFVTICTKNQEHFFGEIVDNAMQLNEIGKLSEQEWIKTLELRPDMNLELGEFVVMPNHFHGIIIIGENQYNTAPVTPRKDAMHCVSTTTNEPSHDTDAMHCVSTITNTPNQFGPQSKNLGSIIRGFKSSVTTQAKKLGNDRFAWQSRFHEHIIRDAKSFETIQNYIANNPSNWKEDKFNK
jgi:putative transposase